MALIGLYTGATEGAMDGTLISNGRTFLTPVDITINAGENEQKIIPLGIRCESGYTFSDVSITTNVYSEDAGSWTGVSDGTISFSNSSTGEEAESALDIESISTTNTIIYMVVSSSNLQTPAINKLTSIEINYTATTDTTEG